VLRRSVAPASIALGLGLVLSGCQSIQGVIDDVTGSGSTTTEQDADPNAEATETTEETTDAPQVEENIEEADPAVPVAAVPTCQEIYSDAQVVAFEEEGRQSEGDISQDGYGHGTTNQELIAILEGVRDDLRVSCTWYLPPEFSSTTSISILSTEAMVGVEDILNVAADSQTTLGSGALWKLESSSSNISGEYIANEAHYIAPTECPTSLAQTNCSVWFTSTNSSGSSEELTRDAAAVFGALN
jgi:hypothetical protein